MYKIERCVYVYLLDMKNDELKPIISNAEQMKCGEENTMIPG